MKRKHFKQFARLAALLLFAAILAGCTATPDNTGNNSSGAGTLDDDLFPDFPVLGSTTAPPAPETGSPATTSGLMINLPEGKELIGQDPTTQPGWGNILTSNQPFVSPTAPVWGGISVITTSPGAATPSPTPMILKLGAKGPEVSNLQRKLKALGYNIGSVDGDFGPSTEAAVKAFQERNKLYVDGIAGTSTLNKLNSSSALPPRPTATPTPRATATPRIRDNVFLKLGSTGSDVRKLQERLIELGYLMGKPNGQFDQMTQEAVIAFQNRHTSYSDGIAGPDTLRKLYSSSAHKTTSAAGIIGTSIQRGLMDSPVVRRIQQKLKDLRFYTGSVDGDFGASTEAAVKAFQAANGLRADGKVGSNTYEALFSSGAATASPGPGQTTAAPTRIPFYTNVTPNPEGEVVTLREGNSGSLVRRLQQALKDQGFYNGPVDGMFGFATTEAVKAFQKSRGLSQDGVAGRGTQQYLYQGSFPPGS